MKFLIQKLSHQRFHFIWPISSLIFLVIYLCFSKTSKNLLIQILKFQEFLLKVKAVCQKLILRRRRDGPPRDENQTIRRPSNEVFVIYHQQLYDDNPPPYESVV